MRDKEVVLFDDEINLLIQQKLDYDMHGSCSLKVSKKIISEDPFVLAVPMHAEYLQHLNNE